MAQRRCRTWVWRASSVQDKSILITGATGSLVSCAARGAGRQGAMTPNRQHRPGLAGDGGSIGAAVVTCRPDELADAELVRRHWADMAVGRSVGGLGRQYVTVPKDGRPFPGLRRCDGRER